MSNLDPFASTKKKPAQPKFDNFLEAFKDTRAAAKPKSDAGQSDGSFDFESFLNQQEKRIRQQERQRFEQLNREIQVVYSREAQQDKLEIESIKIEIQKIAKEVGPAMAEAEKAAFQLVAAPGKYHKNFFARILTLLKLARKQISEGRNCLAIHNHRQNSKSYWGNVKSGGSSFLMHHDRAVATQAG